MPSQEFKPVELVELHDSGVCLSPEHSSEALGWREFKEYEGTGYSLAGEDICRIAQIFGLDPQPILAKSIKGEVQRIDPECLEFKIVKSRQDLGRKTDSRHYGAMERIKNIWARIEGPQLLQLKVEFIQLDEERKETTALKKISYSGSYSVWWA